MAGFDTGTVREDIWFDALVAQLTQVKYLTGKTDPRVALGLTSKSPIPPVASTCAIRMPVPSRFVVVARKNETDR